MLVNPGTKRYMFPEFLSRNTNIAILVIVLLYPGLLLPIEVFQMVKMYLSYFCLKTHLFENTNRLTKFLNLKIFWVTFKFALSLSVSLSPKWGPRYGQ